ncbi:Protein of unknown function [Thermobacillus xylanilyticus]|nr:Protein of unknown function [Thermobacillus xylanilyticus]
MKDKRL